MQISRYRMVCKIYSPWICLCLKFLFKLLFGVFLVTYLLAYFKWNVMQNTEKIKTAIGRTKKALTLKPSLGKGTGVSKTCVTDGLTCQVQESNWKFTVDMPESVGGNNLGPTPGVYGRAALGSCLAIGYMMKAAELDIEIRHLEIEVQADFDDGALFGTAENKLPPGYLEVRYSIHIESDAPEEKIMAMVIAGDAHSPYLDIFKRVQKCIRKVNIVRLNNLA
jgi:uncharacterized OsmC-like protein